MQGLATWLRRSPRRVTALAAIFIALVAAGSLARQWGGPIYWETDALFYQAQLLEIRGADKAPTLEKLFQGPDGARARGLDRAAQRAGHPPRVTNPAWVAYSTRFYERRQLLPAIGAALYPILGDHSLETLSLLGYVALGVFLFLLLRRRFALSTSMVVAFICLALPPLRNWAIYPLTDTWGAALLAAGLLAGLSVVEHGPKRLPWWILAVVALAFTRDIAFILVLAALTLLVFTRTKRAALLTGTGILAALPAPLFLGGVPLRQLLAYVFNDINIPKSDSWGSVLRGYGPDVRHMLNGYADYLPGHLLVAGIFVVGILLLAFARRGRDPLFLLARGAALGYAAFLVIAPTFSAFRYEIAFIPMLAVGLGVGVDWIRVRVTPWLESRVLPRLGVTASGGDAGLGVNP
jgi:hypothetical protein